MRQERSMWEEKRCLKFGKGLSRDSSLACEVAVADDKPYPQQFLKYIIMIAKMRKKNMLIQTSTDTVRSKIAADLRFSNALCF